MSDFDDLPGGPDAPATHYQLDGLRAIIRDQDALLEGAQLEIEHLRRAAAHDEQRILQEIREKDELRRRLSEAVEALGAIGRQADEHWCRRRAASVLARIEKEEVRKA